MASDVGTPKKGILRGVRAGGGSFSPNLLLELLELLVGDERMLCALWFCISLLELSEHKFAQAEIEPLFALARFLVRSKSLEHFLLLATCGLG
jgi:hypothetical protein